MFSALDGPPRILRLFGVGALAFSSWFISSSMVDAYTGTVHEYGTPEYDALIPATTRKPGSRAVIVIDVYQVGTVRTTTSRASYGTFNLIPGNKPQSCGFAVPVYGFVTQRTQLLRYFDKREAVDRSFASSQQQQPGSCSDDNCDSEVAPVKGDTVPQGSLRAYWLLKNTPP
jgi:hypothetical protein